MPDARLALLRALIDDAGLFPPARKPMAGAVADHRAARAGEHGWLLGRFLCPASRLPELSAAGPGEEWTIGAVLDGEDWRADLARVAAYAGPGRIDAVETRLPAEPEALAAATPETLALFLEVPRSGPDELDAALERIAGLRGAGAKLRCGGLAPDAFPDDAFVARFVATCARVGLPFKATAGLHHPFRTRDDALGVMQHGFVNLLAAAGAPSGTDAPAIVAERDASAFALTAGGLAWRGREVDAATARRRFTAFGSCSFDEPVGDLVAAGALPALARA